VSRAYLLVSGDTGSKLVINCTNEDGSPIDLTGRTVLLEWHDAGGALQSRAMTVTNPTDPAGGVAEYTFLTGELISPAMDFQVRITITATGFFVHNIELLSVPVREVLA